MEDARKKFGVAHTPEEKTKHTKPVMDEELFTQKQQSQKQTSVPMSGDSLEDEVSIPKSHHEHSTETQQPDTKTNSFPIFSASVHSSITEQNIPWHSPFSAFSYD